MITTDNLLFSVVDVPGFCRVLQYLVPWYMPPAHRTFSRNVVPAVFRAAKEYVKGEMLHSLGATMYFMSDIWTSQQAHGTDDRQTTRKDT